MIDMKMKLRLFIIGLVSAVVFSAVAEAKVPDIAAKPSREEDDTVRIMTIGNSFCVDAVDHYLWELASEAGKPVVIGNPYHGGCSLARHAKNIADDTPYYSYHKIWKDGKVHDLGKTTLQKVIDDEDWDYIIIQEQSALAGNFDSLKTSLPEILSFIHRHTGSGTRVMMMQTWAYPQNSDDPRFAEYGNSQQAMYQAITDATVKAVEMMDGLNKLSAQAQSLSSKAMKTMFLPIGTAVQNARTSSIGDNMNRDNKHLDYAHGRYAAALTVFGLVFGGEKYGISAMAPDGTDHKGKIKVLDMKFVPAGVDSRTAAAVKHSVADALARPYSVTDESAY
jgi:hypothetical protein